MARAEGARTPRPSREGGRAGASWSSSWDLEPVDLPRVALMTNDRELRGWIIDRAAVVEDLADRPAVVTGGHWRNRIAHRHRAGRVRRRVPGNDAVTKHSLGRIEATSDTADGGEQAILLVEDDCAVTSLWNRVGVAPYRQRGSIRESVRERQSHLIDIGHRAARVAGRTADDADDVIEIGRANV